MYVKYLASAMLVQAISDYRVALIENRTSDISKLEKFFKSEFAEDLGRMSETGVVPSRIIAIFGSIPANQIPDFSEIIKKITP